MASVHAPSTALGEKISFAFSDHRLAQRDIAARDVGAGLEDIHRFLARGGLINRRFDGVQAAPSAARALLAHQDHR